MNRWQVLKNGVPVRVCDTIKEAEDAYMKFDADEIRRIEDDDDNDFEPHG